MEEKYITFNDTIIFYKTIGKGLPVVFVHGFAEDSSIWDKQVEFLKDKYHLIVPDLPGSGRSAMINQKDAGLEDYAEVLNKILQAEKIEKCIMIGHSMGGYTTLAFAEKYPGSLTGFGLFHSSAYADDDAKLQTRKKAIDFIRSNGTDAFLKTTIPGLFYKPDNSEDVNALIERGRSFKPEALIQYYEAMMARPDRTTILREAAVPVLFVMGEHDKAVPFKHSLEQSHLPGYSFIDILRNSAHMGMLEEAPKANKILANFLLAGSL